MAFSPRETSLEHRRMRRRIFLAKVRSLKLVFYIVQQDFSVVLSTEYRHSTVAIVRTRSFSTTIAISLAFLAAFRSPIYISVENIYES